MTTQKAFANYQEIIDLHTESDTVSVVGVHTPSTSAPQRMLGGFFRQFRKFKYMGASLALVPAARLPADPLQVSLEAGDPTIDPRDMLNPILWHGCHGNDMGAILNQFYAGTNASANAIFNLDNTSDSVDHWMGDLPTTMIGNDFLEALYYRALTDNTWAKAHPQKGFRKAGLKPMVYTVASNMQLNPKGFQTGTGIQPRVHDSHASETLDVNNLSEQSPSPGINGAGTLLAQGVLGTGVSGQSQAATNLTIGNMVGPGSDVGGVSPYVEFPLNRSGHSFLTPRLTSMGWMDTRQPMGGMPTPIQSETLDGTSGDAVKIAKLYNYVDAMSWTRVPKVFMGMIMFPPAYKTEQYYRLVINHRFGFAGFRGQSMMPEGANDVVKAPTVYNYN